MINLIKTLKIFLKNQPKISAAIKCSFIYLFFNENINNCHSNKKY